MHVQPRKLANGETRYYLRYWKDNKNLCVPVRVIRSDPNFAGEYPFKTREDALRYIKKSKAIEDYRKHSEGLKYLAKKREYGDFLEYRDILKRDVIESAPNSYESTMHYFDRFVLPFFLDEKMERNVNKWHLLFKEYRIWLMESAYKDGHGDKLISYSTKNHCVRALNKFLKSMCEVGVLTPACNIKCTGFARHLVDENARGAEDIIKENEYTVLKKSLGKKSKEFFICLYNTGMRFNELYSLSFNDIYFDEDIEEGLEGWMKDSLESNGYEIYGYISLTSQCKSKNRDINESGEVERKPLKGRKTTKLKDGRVIPILDAETMDILIDRYNRCVDEYERGQYGENEENYFLFYEDHNEIRRDFYKHCKKGMHACRHSFTTRLIGKTRHQILTRTITGHRSLDVFDRYVHIYEEYVKKARKPKKMKKRARIDLQVIEGEKKDENESA